MRRVLIFLAIVALAATVFPSAAEARRSTHFTDDSTFINCDAIANEQGTIRLGVEDGTDYPPFAWLAYEEPGANGEPAWISRDAHISAGADGMSYTGTFRLHRYLPQSESGYGAFVGEASLSLQLEAIGEPQPIDYRSRGSNHRVRVVGTTQELMASGSVVLPGGLEFAIAGCQAAHDQVEVFTNDPDSYVSNSSGVYLSCAWEADDQSVYLGGWQEGGFADMGMFMTDAAREFTGSSNEVTLTTSAAEASFDLHRLTGDEMEAEPTGSVAVSAVLSRTEDRFRLVDRFGFSRFVYSGVRLDISGEVRISRDGEPDVVLDMDSSSCGAQRFRSSIREATPNGTPRLGPPLANDLPADATAMAIGESVSVRSTTSTDVAPEAPCLVGEDEIPFGHTAWWAFEGSGDVVTIDTSGSDFDTVVGVYVLGGDELTQVGCVDDVEGLQAVLSTETDAGAGYLIQVGGYGASSGRLELAIR